MFRKLFILFVFALFFVSCASMPNGKTQPPQPQEVVVKVQAADPTKVTVKEKEKERINKSMEVPNPEGRLGLRRDLCRSTDVCARRQARADCHRR